MDQNEVLKFYSRRNIQKEIVRICRDREVAIKYGDRGYGHRPDIIQFDNDILDIAKKGATSFHVSEEHWHDPLKLDVAMNKQQLDELRKGWDFLIDIDSSNLEHSKIAASLVVEALKAHSINHFSIKFSGNRGFHIGVPFSTFPDSINNQESKLLFPDGARILASYLKYFIKDNLKDLLKQDNPFSLVDIDTVLISSRHLFRAPYSFNEKSGLISIPIRKEDILSFDSSKAVPQNVNVDIKFLAETENAKKEASHLFIEAFDWQASQKPRQTAIPGKARTGIQYNRESNAISNEQLFPPCMQLGLSGLDDGKKRFVFIAINFLRNMGWNLEQVESRLIEWNKLNKKPLPESYIKSQVLWFKRQAKAVLPPNCDNASYMLGIGICKPDHFCKSIKNPVSYPEKRISVMKQDRKKSSANK